jgi:starvation-inducible DNA-binding protein
VEEETGHPPAKDMIRNLVADQGAIVAVAHKVIDAAEKARDQATMDLAIRRLDVHEKNAWMLRSHLE